MKSLLKPFALLLTVALTAALCGGCSGQPSSPSSGASSGDASSQWSPPGELTEERRIIYAGYLSPLRESGAILSDWEGAPPEETYDEAVYGVARNLEILDSSKKGNVLTVIAEVHGTPLVDPDTTEECLRGDVSAEPGHFYVYYDEDSVRHNLLPVVSAPDDYHYPWVPLGKATVELREAADGPLYLSCDYEPYDAPGFTYLRARTQELEAELSASQKPDLSQYDQRLVEYIRRIVLSQRYIQSAADITLWDLENLCTQLSLDYNTLGDEDGVVPEDYRMDGELLRLMPNLRSVECRFILEDYSVFEGMEKLEYLSLDLETFDDAQPAPDISTLRVGHTGKLALENFRQDIAVDLTGSNVDTLLVDSWVAAVTEFKGCENLTSLEFYNTRSDTRIVNAGSFPSLRTLQMNFFSDYARFRDFSQLATFGEDVEISLALSYQAANNKTVETLAGVRLDHLTLDPEGGTYPLGEPDPALVEKIDVQDVIWLSGGP